MGRAESRPRERQSRRLSFGLRRAAGASCLPFLSRLPRAAAGLALALPLLAAALLVPAGEARAADITLVSNTGQVARASDTSLPGKAATAFTAGGNTGGYNLASVGIDLGSIGANAAVAVTLRSEKANGLPGGVVYTFTNPTFAANSVNTFTAPPGATLEANKTYFVHIENTTGETGGSHLLKFARTTSDNEDTGGASEFEIGNTRYWCAVVDCSNFATTSTLLVFTVKGSAATNAAPTSANKTVTLEGSSYTFSASDFAFIDTVGDTLDSVTIVTKPAKGTLALSGSTVVTNQSIPAADLGNLTFTPASGDTGTGYASFTFKVSDGTDLSAEAYTMTIDVPPLPVVQFYNSVESYNEPAFDFASDFQSVPNVFIRLTGTQQGTATVNYTVSSSGSNAATPCPTGTTLSSCANAGYDFLLTDDNRTAAEYSGTSTFSVGDIQIGLSFIIIKDTAVEGDETFTITLSDPRPSTDRGLSLSLRQGWGVSPTGGMDALLGRETLAGLAATVGVQGYAGTGKTTMLNRARTLAEKKGYRMAGLAPSASAVQTLASEAGIESETLQRFLARNAGVAEGRLTRKGAREMRAAFAKTILVVDEGSLASTVQARDLLRIANELRIPRVVLVGDAKQLDAVDAGKPFAQLQAAGMQTATMDEIMRQRDPALKEAVDVDQAALRRVLLEHVDQPVLEGDDAVPLDPVDLLAGLLREEAFVGRDAHIGDAPARGEVVDDDVGAQPADQFRVILSECHDDLLMGLDYDDGLRATGGRDTLPNPRPLNSSKPSSTSITPGGAPLPDPRARRAPPRRDPPPPVPGRGRRSCARDRPPGAPDSASRARPRSPRGRPPGRCPARRAAGCRREGRGNGRTGTWLGLHLPLPGPASRRRNSLPPSCRTLAPRKLSSASRPDAPRRTAGEGIGGAAVNGWRCCPPRRRAGSARPAPSRRRGPDRGRG